MMNLKLRPPIAADHPEIGRIVFEAFKSIAEKHNFPLDFPSAEKAAGLTAFFANNPAIFGVVAELDGKVVGSNFLDQRDPIAAVGPITVDPAVHGKGIGRRLMDAVIERGRASAAPGIRLVQDAFNTASMSLYTSLGFDAREPLALMRGKVTAAASSSGVQARLLEEKDLPACGELCRSIHGYERANELRDAIKMFKPFVLLRYGEVAAYSSAPAFWPLNHGVGRTEADLQELLAAASATSPDPLMLLVPIRRAGFFRWCLANGLRVVKPMTLMSMGDYREPAGGFYPSVGY
jgi:predicted N-acetyltransferase YhbS